eukprot:gene1905-2163_t
MAVCLECGVNAWYEDQNMKEDLKRYVQQNLKCKEMLNFMKRGYAVYAWRMLTLARLVCDVMFTADPQGMEARSVKKKRNKPKQPFMSNGPNWTLSFDGHDML